MLEFEADLSCCLSARRQGAHRFVEAREIILVLKRLYAHTHTHISLSSSLLSWHSSVCSAHAREGMVHLLCCVACLFSEPRYDDLLIGVGPHGEVVRGGRQQVLDLTGSMSRTPGGVRA